MSDWFDVDREGLRKILERRGKAWAIFELIQNAWDTNTKTVKVKLEAIPQTAQAWLTVEDDDPEGFHDLTHAFTLFAESGKKGDPTKRGRFNLGCKLVLAMCFEATVSSTSGEVVFDATGRERFSGHKRRRESGSEFKGRIALTRAEMADIEAQLYKLHPPPNVTTIVRIDNGARSTEAELEARDPDEIFEATLQTEIADEEGFLRRRERKTTVHLFGTVSGEAWLYELGLPVQPIDGPWHIDVQQKLPLGLERDAVPPAFLSKLHTLVANVTAYHLPTDEFTKPWIAEVVQDKNASVDVVQQYLHAKYGDKITIAVPGADGEESARKAQAQGFTVIRGGSEAKTTWSKIREHDLAKPVTALFPPMRASDDYTELRLDDLPASNRNLVSYVQTLGQQLLGKGVLVRFIDGPHLSVAATWAKRDGQSPLITFNLAHLGRDWFAKGPTPTVNELLIHEFAHDFGDHLEKAFDDAMARLGAKLIDIALRDPEVFEQFYTVQR
jgi:hypothetical protein